MFTLPELPYSYESLEPYIDAETMKIHHDKHHATYVENLNKALEKHPDLSVKNVEELLINQESLPGDIRQTVINNAGGHYNHSFFWGIMSPRGGDPPKGNVAAAIDSTFGSFEKFKEAFTAKAQGVFGSGWAFLILKPDKKLALKRHSFQNAPIMQDNRALLGLDVWEHAYYLKYQNRRADYIKAWWNVVNWSQVEEIFAKAL